MRLKDRAQMAKYNHKKALQKTSGYKIALYIRVSTEEQAENPEGSIRNQEDRLRQAVDYKNRLGNFGEIKGVFVDAGISAKNMKRPRLQDLLRAVRLGDIDLIMVTEISRLSRNTKDFIEMWDLMRAQGCRFLSLREDFDTTTAAGEMVLFQLMNLAQFERKQTSERVEANIAARAQRGLYNGGTMPAGYRTIQGRPGFLEIDPEMAETIRAAFTTFLREGSLASAAKWLNENGYSLRKQIEGGGGKRRVGHFTVDNLQALLRNKAYIGVKAYRHRGELREVKAVWPAIIDEVSFLRVGKLLGQNRRRLKPQKPNKMPYILSGVLFCAKCRSHMPGKSATGNGGKVGYYEHAWATKRDATLSKKLFRCEPHRVPAKKLEPFVLTKINEFMTSDQMKRRIFEKVRARHGKNPNRVEIERIKAKVQGVASQIEALTERLAELPKEVSAVPIYRQLEKLQGIKQDYEAKLQALLTANRASADRVASLETFQNFSAHYQRLVRDGMDVSQKKADDPKIRAPNRSEPKDGENSLHRR